MESSEEKIDIKYDRWARWTYDKFRLKQPHIETQGLWQDPNGWSYYIKCKNISSQSKAKDGRNLIDWFNHSCRIITSSIELVESPSIGSKKIPERSLKEVIQLSGMALNVSQLIDNFKLLLPKDFPDFLIYDDAKQQEIVVFVKRKLNRFEKNSLIKTLKILQLPGTCRMQIGYPPIKKKNKSPIKKDNSIDLVPSRNLKNNIPKHLLSAFEEDEDFWLTNRLKILGNTSINRNEILSKSWMELKSSCLIDATVFPPFDIRTYLSLYKNVIIAPPIITKKNEIYDAFGIKEGELIELVRLGRVKLILPQSIERYSQKFLSSISECFSQRMLFSRKLASITIIESRKRFPLLYPALGIRDRQKILHAILKTSQNVVDTNLKSIFHLLEKTLSEMWLASESLLHLRGAMATNPLGFGRIIGDLIYGLKKRDLRLEFGHASKSVEWAGALKATIFPIDTDDYSEAQHTSIISNAYTGIPNNITPLYSFGPNKVIENILAIDRGVPIIEFANSFQGDDVDRLRQFIEDLCYQKEYNETLLNDAISNFNREVSIYEKNRKLHCKINLQGLILTIPPLINQAVGPWVSLGMWMLGVMSENRQNIKLSRMFDYFEGVLTKTNPHAVLVGRIKRNIKA